MKLRLSCLLLSVLVLVSLSLKLKTHKVDANGPQTIHITLESSERVFGEVKIQSLVDSFANKEQKFYAFRADNGNLVAYNSEYKISREIPFAQASRVMTVGTQGDLYIADGFSNRVRILSAVGKPLGEFNAPSPVSLATLSNGNILSVSPTGGKLFQMYAVTGLAVKAFGEMEKFDDKNPVQNRFLNRGEVVVGPSDTIYYIPRHAPNPIIQRYSISGKLLSEFAIEGNAVKYQSEIESSFLREKKSNVIGGFSVITAATVDSSTGHLWIGMNGKSTMGIVYEYNPNGVKLREYSFLLNDKFGAKKVITGVKDIAVKSPWIYILTWDGDVYRFNMNNSATLTHRVENIKASLFESNQFSSFPYISSAARSEKSIKLQTSCGPEQTVACTVNCQAGANPATQDCFAEAKRRLATNDIVTGGTCNIYPNTSYSQPSCNITINWCNTQNGVTGSLTTQLNCTAPPRTNNDGDGYALEDDPPDCDDNDPSSYPGAPTANCDWNDDSDCDGISNDMECVWSPIVIDVAGNGFNLTDGAGGVLFDLNSDGVRERLSWMSANSDDAWLALDRSGNGVIDTGVELFGNHTPQPPSSTPNGFLALAEYDKPQNGGNNDGKIDNRDSIFSSLRLWQDINHNGISEQSELHTLTSLNVISISLDYSESRQRDQYGNEFRYRARVRDARGAQVGRWAYDVFLVLAP
jgi:hypothetical protein